MYIEKKATLFVCCWFLHMLNVFDLVDLLTTKRAHSAWGGLWGVGVAAVGAVTVNLINTSIAVECRLWTRGVNTIPNHISRFHICFSGDLEHIKILTPNCKYAHTKYTPCCICAYTLYICCYHRINQSTGVKIYDLKHNHNTLCVFCFCFSCVCGEAFHALIISWRIPQRNSRVPRQLLLPSFASPLHHLLLFTNYVCFSYWPRLAFFLFELFFFPQLIYANSFQSQWGAASAPSPHHKKPLFIFYVYVAMRNASMGMQKVEITQKKKLKSMKMSTTKSGKFAQRRRKCYYIILICKFLCNVSFTVISIHKLLF